MDAKCTDSQWFGDRAASANMASNYHHHGHGERPATEDDEDDEMAAILLPDLHGSSDILEEKHIRELSKCLPARAEGYSWTLAFTTTTMGFSLKSLYRALSRYEGPVLLIIRDNEQSIFGAFSSCSLKPSESFYGTGETYLFTFKQPKQSTSTVASSAATTTASANSGVIDVTNMTIKSNSNQLSRSSVNNNNNSDNKNSPGGRSGQKKQHYFKRFPWTGDNLYFIKGNSDSLAFGAGEGNFGLWLDEDLYHGSTHSCLTFNNEPLAHHEDFVVCTLECWCFL